MAMHKQKFDLDIMEQTNLNRNVHFMNLKETRSAR
jgi:hypothetical protein